MATRRRLTPASRPARWLPPDDRTTRTVRWRPTAPRALRAACAPQQSAAAGTGPEATAARTRGSRPGAATGDRAGPHRAGSRSTWRRPRRRHRRPRRAAMSARGSRVALTETRQEAGNVVGSFNPGASVHVRATRRSVCASLPPTMANRDEPAHRLATRSTSALCAGTMVPFRTSSAGTSSRSRR